MYQVKKRDGRLVDFDLERITNAMRRAFEACRLPVSEDILERLALRVTAQLSVIARAEGGDHVDEDGQRGEGVVSVEQIQDEVEEVLATMGYMEVARAYILYRTQRGKRRELSAALVDAKHLMDGYLDELDWRVQENATVTYSVGGLILSNSGAITANYWLSEIYDPDVANAHRNCDIHIHDLSMLTGYCAGWSLRQLIQEGLGGVPGRTSSKPAKHLASLCNQMVNFLGIMQNEWAGAQAFSSFDTYLAAFVRADKLTQKEVETCIESFVFGVNTPSRWGTQAPFSNITLDWTVPPDLADQPAIVGGVEQAYTYGDLQPEMDMVNRALLKVMLEGDANGRGFQYPIPTYSITRDFDWSDNENNRLLFDLTARYGTPYFSNYINSELDPSDVRSMCCRLRLDLRELRRKSGGYFGSGESTGSIGVVTINLPRLAWRSWNEEEFFAELDHLMDLSARSLDTKREAVTRFLEAGLYPYTKRYLGNFDSHFSTIGLVGMNEACRNAAWIGGGLETEAGQAFAERVLDHMLERLSIYQEQTGHLYNLEATPAESTAYRFARHDVKACTGILTAGTAEAPYYTNSTHLPVDHGYDLFTALDHQDPLQTRYTSGTVFHAFLGERLSDWRGTAQLVRRIAETHRLPYFTISPTYSICASHGYLNGEETRCPHCGERTEVYSRITGYYRPVGNWNTGKAQEFRERHAWVGAAEVEAAERAVHVDERRSSARSAAPVATLEREADVPAVNDGKARYWLLTRTSCPSCKQAANWLERLGQAYSLVDADEHPDFAREHGLMAVPSLVIESEGGQLQCISGAGPVLAHCAQLNAAQ